MRYPASGSGYPLIVFGHGFALTPAVYAHLLRAVLGLLTLTLLATAVAV